MQNDLLKGVERALVIQQPYIGRTLKQLKPWEMRSQSINLREKIGLIEQGTGFVVGTADLVNCLELSVKELQAEEAIKNHTLDYKNPDLWKWRYAWILENVIEFDDPVEYKHPQGAVIWVRSGAWL